MTKTSCNVTVHFEVVTPGQGTIVDGTTLVVSWPEDLEVCKMLARTFLSSLTKRNLPITAGSLTKPSLCYLSSFVRNSPTTLYAASLNTCDLKGREPCT